MGGVNRKNNRDNIYTYIYMYTLNKGPGYLSRNSDSLRAGRFENRIPVEERFSAHVQTGPGAAYFTMGTGSFQAVKRPGRGVDRPPHLAPRLSKE
jgi:hypothetical protein